MPPRFFTLAALAALVVALPAPVRAQVLPRPHAGPALAAPDLPAAAARSTTAPMPRQLGLAPAPFQLFLLITNANGQPVAQTTSTTDPLYPGWCDLYGFGDGASTPPPSRVAPSRSAGVTTAPSAPGAALSDLTFNKAVDATSTSLFKLLATRAKGNLSLVVVRSTQDRIETWRIRCDNAYVSSQVLSIGGDSFVESDTITPGTVEWSYLDTNSAGQVVADLFTRYDQVAGVVRSGRRAPVYPGDVDTDGDGITDAAERFYGLDPNNPADALSDLDGDGQSNVQEFLAATDAADARSVLRVTAVQVPSNAPAASRSSTVATVTWNSVADKTYAVESAPAPDGPWTTRATVFSAGDGTTTQTVTTAGGVPTFFYRVRVVP